MLAQIINHLTGMHDTLSFDAKTWLQSLTSGNAENRHRIDVDELFRKNGESIGSQPRSTEWSPHENLPNDSVDHQQSLISSLKGVAWKGGFFFAVFLVAWNDRSIHLQRR